MAFLSVKVTPNARQSELIGWLVDENGGEVLRIKLRVPPVDGKANRELIAFLSRLLDVPKSSVSLIRGEKSRSKTVEIAGLQDSDFRSLIDASLP